MTRLKLILCILGVTLCFPVVMAQVSLGSGSSKANEFTVVSSKANARLFFDEHDFEVVKKVADLLPGYFFRRWADFFFYDAMICGKDYILRMS